LVYRYHTRCRPFRLRRNFAVREITYFGWVVELFMVRPMNAIPSPSLAVPELIAQIIYLLCQTVTMRLRAGTVTPAQLAYVVRRLLGIRKRFRFLVARIRAGRVPAERTRKPRPGRPEPDPDFPLGFRPPPPGWRRWAVREDKPVPAWRSLRQHMFAWVCALAPAVPEFRDSAAAHGEALRLLLAAPEMRALLLASRHVGDSLRPLCWMLGINTSFLYPARPAASNGISGPDPLVPARADANPTLDQNEGDAAGTPGPPLPGFIEPPPARPSAPEGGEFFATA
jgi:hypothetical protein